MDSSHPWILGVGIGSSLFGIAASVRVAVSLRRVRNNTWIRTVGRVQKVGRRLTPDAVPVAHLSYEYEVDGKPHRSSTISADGSNGLQYPSDLKFAEQFEVGDPIEVFFSASEPDVACLRPRQYGEAPVLIAVSVVFLLVGFFMLWQAS